MGQEMTKRGHRKWKSISGGGVIELSRGDNDYQKYIFE